MLMPEDKHQQGFSLSFPLLGKRKRFEAYIVVTFSSIECQDKKYKEDIIFAQ
ncbi:putative E3 ubiquitin-protein ligase MARCH10 isoform X1 [Iris pallida]|uniref:E3 ubiquitin-protein ligase MARCH10 isoform X1 n=1 Tax=Iris pallida TaxID=29817 RepID=A0AAX6GJ32_IRIPA|nr:putative E3 ubiquitin-protein ligase MARCH10 isoform X1 [Iris pallida]